MKSFIIFKNIITMLWHKWHKNSLNTYCQYKGKAREKCVVITARGGTLPPYHKCEGLQPPASLVIWPCLSIEHSEFVVLYINMYVCLLLPVHIWVQLPCCSSGREGSYRM